MTSDRERCGLTSLLPMSCRGRAEAFARRLSSRLKSLSSEDGNGSADETSWLAVHENAVALSQPRQSTQPDTRFDFGTLESPGSPAEGIQGPEFEKLINRDKHSDVCHCSVEGDSNTNCQKVTNNGDSRDGIYYDVNTDEEEPQKANGQISNASTNEINYAVESNVECDTFTEIGSSESCPLDSNGSSDEWTLKSCEDHTFAHSTDSLSELPQINDIDECRCNEPTGDIETGRNDNHLNSNDFHAENVEGPSEKCSTTNTDDDNTKFNLKDPGFYDNDDDISAEERIPRVRRCSSLKTGKTPPGTPGQKKFVRFADVLGLDLADVRTFLDEIPKIPTSAYNDLQEADLIAAEADPLATSLKQHGVKTEKMLVPLFQQPGGLPNFIDRIRENNVCLENALVEDPIVFCIGGIVRVKNLDFHKTVHIRYSLDSWKTFADVQAVYVEQSCDGFSDKFSFSMYAHTLTVGQKLQFAVRFQCKGCQYWDNNKGANYCFECLPTTNDVLYTPSPITDTSECCGASFY